jgi:hypothetical protein
MKQNVDARKYFFCATFAGRGAYRLVAEENLPFKAGLQKQKQ